MSLAAHGFEVIKNGFSSDWIATIPDILDSITPYNSQPKGFLNTAHIVYTPISAGLKPIYVIYIHVYIYIYVLYT